MSWVSSSHTEFGTVPAFFLAPSWATFQTTPVLRSVTSAALRPGRNEIPQGVVKSSASLLIPDGLPLARGPTCGWPAVADGPDTPTAVTAATAVSAAVYGRTRCTAECAKRDILMPFLSWRDRVIPDGNDTGVCDTRGCSVRRRSPVDPREKRRAERRDGSFPECSGAP
ncbi:hypothetical protein GCM10010524_20980 [Streptomyces mexicanus]